MWQLATPGIAVFLFSAFELRILGSRSRNDVTALPLMFLGFGAAKAALSCSSFSCLIFFFVLGMVTGSPPMIGSGGDGFGGDDLEKGSGFLLREQQEAKGEGSREGAQCSPQWLRSTHGRGLSHRHRWEYLGVRHFRFFRR
ncbi:hypothetical protein GW17_00027580 [Ensete ventricosum]|nr:hypothetical protein GW17_00027580 [Ensete ventricosum]